MKEMYSDIFDGLITKYGLESHSYSKEKVVSLAEYSLWINHFIDRWGGRFVQGYYNLELAFLPEKWYKAIDGALELIEKDSPTFKIAQIKFKFGGIRINLFDISDEVFYGLEKLESVLYDDCFYY
jgi:hypothetical protein